MNSDTPAGRVTLRDIARRVGVSHATVSRALRDDQRITEPVRERVRQAAQEMGYTPDPMLSALASYRQGRTGKPIHAALGWVNGWPEPEKLRTYREFDLYWEGARQEALKAGYRLEEFRCPAELLPSRLQSVLRTRGIRGLLLPPGWSGSTPAWGDFGWDAFSLVRFGHSLASPRAHVVTSNQLMDGMLAFESARERGYRRIGLVVWHDSGTRCVRFSAGYLYAQLKVDPGERLPPLTVKEGDRDAEKRLAAWLDDARPDAILTDVQQMRERLGRAGCRVPEDVGLASFSVLDSDADAGIDQGSSKVGAAAVQLLISLIHHRETGIPGTPREVLLPGRWVDGGTLPPRGPQ